MVRRAADLRVTARRAIALLLENVNGLAVLGGASWLYLGIQGFSPHAADVVAGVLLMFVGSWPYVSGSSRR